MADYGQLQWSPDGRPYLVDASGKRYFVPPIVAAQYRDDPRALQWAASQGAHIGAAGGSDTVTGAPDSTLTASRGVWNPDTGQYEQGANWDNIASLGVGGLIAAPYVAGALAAGGSGAGASGLAAGTGAGSAGAAPLASAAIGSGAVPAITGAASGAVTAAMTAPSIIAPVASSLASKVLTSPSLWGTIAGTVANIYSANKQASTADKAAQIAADASKYGVDAQTAASQAAEKFAREQGEYAYQASETANKANYGQYLAREHRLQSVGDLLGAGPRETPAYVPQPDPNYTSTNTPPTVNQALKTSGSGSASAYLKSLLDSGMDPQQASDKTNAQYPGAGALYYAPSSKTSGKAVIGLPDSYLSQETNGWNVTQRGPEGATAAPKAVYTPYVPQSMTQLFAKYGTPAPLTPALQLPGAVGSYF